MSADLYDDIEQLSLAEYGDRIADDFVDQVAYVYENSPFYRQKFDEHDVSPADITDIDDISKLPFTEKDELRESQEQSPPFGHHQASDDIVRVHTSSGTTGRPTYIGLTRSDFESWKTVAQRTQYTGGVREDDTVISTFSDGPFVAGTTNYAYQESGVTFAPVGPGQTDRIIRMLTDGCGSVLLGTISYAQYFLERVREEGIDPATLGLDRLIVGGEPGGGEEHTRDPLEEAFDCQVVELMGNGDMCVSIWGECPRQNGMHFNAQGVVYPELIDPDTGEQIEWEAGAEGELVYSAVNRECVPLVRFRTNDHAVVTETDCGCGRGTACIRCIGRYDDMFIVRGVNVFPQAVRNVVGELDGTNGQIRIIDVAPDTQKKPAPVPIKVEVDESLVSDSSLRDAIEQAIRSKLQFQAEVELVPPATFERSEYKGDLVQPVDDESA
jgi:phenylacetate-CoA ligase